MGKQFDQGHACIIGIGGNLPVSAQDAKGIASILKDSERCAYPASQVHTLTDAQATRANIIAALETLAANTDESSTVLIYFSGHGHQLSQPPLTSYYLLCNGYSTDNLAETAIDGNLFTELLREIPAKKLLVLLDCCHSGGLSDVSDFEVTKAPLPPEATRMFAKGGGRIMIGSSHAEELSYGGKPYSAFTYALMEGLCGKGASEADGYIRAADLAMYAAQVVPTLTKDRQHPVLKMDQADNFVLAYYAAGERQPKGLPPELSRAPVIESVPGEMNAQLTPSVQAIASGNRSVAIGGNVFGSNIVIGDNNVTGSNNVVQHGKYNINVGSMENAKNIDIGDRISDQISDEKG